MIYATDTSAAILSAMESVALSNNGWAWIKKDSALISGLRVAGYTVIETETGTKAYSKTAQAALASDYKARSPASLAAQDGPDYEAMILKKQDWLIAND